MAFAIKKVIGLKFCECTTKSFARASFYKCQKFYSTTIKVNAKPKKNTMLKVALVGAGVGILTGWYLAHRKSEKQEKALNPVVQYKHVNHTVESFPDVQISRRIVIPTDSTGLHLTLFQYPTCPFCCKVRAFLDYYGISYNIVEVNPVLRQQIKWSPYKKVPILLVKTGTSYQQLNDSSVIISVLASFLRDSSSTDFTEVETFYPAVEHYDEQGTKKSEVLNRYFKMNNIPPVNAASKEYQEDERKWRKWADDVLVHTLSPNVYQTTEEALESFQWFSEVGEWDKLFPTWERLLVIYVGAFAMRIIGKKLQKRHNLKKNVRQSLYDECNVWTSELKKRKTKFLGGAQPNLGDLAIYGVLTSIEGCRAFKDMLEFTDIGKWFYQMKEVVQGHGGSSQFNADPVANLSDNTQLNLN